MAEKTHTYPDGDQYGGEFRKGHFKGGRTDGEKFTVYKRIGNQLEEISDIPKYN